MTINNVSQMVSALGAHNGALFVSLLGISNCLGRMIAGLVANATQKYVSRPTWLVLACAVMAVAQILVITGSLVLLYPAAILTGLAYGACWSTTPPLASDIFGNKSFAAIYQFLGLAPAFGSMVCSIGIAGTLYDKFAVKATDGSGETACTGAHCFRYTCMITASMDVVAVVLIAILAFRMRRFYFPKKN
jgi:MFS family permease